MGLGRGICCWETLPVWWFQAQESVFFPFSKWSRKKRAVWKPLIPGQAPGPQVTLAWLVSGTHREPTCRGLRALAWLSRPRPLTPRAVGTSCSLYLDCWLQTGAWLVLSYKLRLVSKVTSPEKPPQETRGEMLTPPAPALPQSLSVILVDFFPPISLITFWNDLGHLLIDPLHHPM